MEQVQLQMQEGLEALIADIEQSHHRFTREQLERIANILANIGEVPDQVRKCIDALREDLIPHLMKEERILFPYIAALEQSNGNPPEACFGNVANPINAMQLEHRDVKALLGEMRQAAGNYQAAGEPLAQLYAALEALEQDLIKHIYKEDEVLFPRALKATQYLAAE